MNVQIKVAGVDITSECFVKAATFTSRTNGAAGACEIRLRAYDVRSFTVGSRIECLVDSVRIWDGYLTEIEYAYPFSAMQVASDSLRIYVLHGTDINVLFQKRIVYNKANPASMDGPLFAAYTPDTTAISTLVTNWLDLSGDNLDTTSGVVGVANVNEDQPARPFGPSQTWGAAMSQISALSGAVWYLDADRVLRYVDDEAVTAPFGLSDNPSSGFVGIRDIQYILGNEPLTNDYFAWGMGFGGAQPVVAEAKDSSSISTYGLWQGATTVNSVYKQATINRIANSYVYGSPANHRGRNVPQPMLRCTMVQPGLRAGMGVHVILSAWNVDIVLPIRQLTFHYVAPGFGAYELVLSRVVDTPWTTIDPYRISVPQLPSINLPATPYIPPTSLPSTAPMSSSYVIDDWYRTPECQACGGLPNQAVVYDLLGGRFTSTIGSVPPFVCDNTEYLLYSYVPASPVWPATVTSNVTPYGTPNNGQDWGLSNAWLTGPMTVDARWAFDLGSPRSYCLVVLGMVWGVGTGYNGQLTIEDSDDGSSWSTVVTHDQFLANILPYTLDAMAAVSIPARTKRFVALRYVEDRGPGVALFNGPDMMFVAFYEWTPVDRATNGNVWRHDSMNGATYIFPLDPNPPFPRPSIPGSPDVGIFVHEANTNSPSTQSRLAIAPMASNTESFTLRGQAWFQRPDTSTGKGWGVRVTLLDPGQTVGTRLTFAVIPLDSGGGVYNVYDMYISIETYAGTSYAMSECGYGSFQSCPDRPPPPILPEPVERWLDFSISANKTTNVVTAQAGPMSVQSNGQPSGVVSGIISASSLEIQIETLTWSPSVASPTPYAIAFDNLSMEQSYSGSGTPLVGPNCQVFFGPGSTIQLAGNFVPGSCEVWVNGVYTPSFTEDVPTNSIILGFTPQSNDVVQVCYETMIPWPRARMV